MSKSVSVFDETMQLTNVWLKDLMADLGWSDRHRAYLALRVTLHALRDHLSAEQVAKLGAQLPMLVRGFYYEGWHPAHKPVKDKTADAFLTHIWDGLNRPSPPDKADPERVAQAVFRLLAQHMSPGAIEHVRPSLPKALRALWPTEEAAGPEIVPL